MTTTPPLENTSWLIRHEFLLRRLHSLSGLIPVGAYMVIHLMTNASVLDSPATFQQNVYRIHSLGKFLPFVEWGFIFLPLIFHAVFGVVIVRSGMLNYGNYPTSENARYTLQRISGMIAFLFIFWHVFHMHGWFHNKFWVEAVAEPLHGAQFRPYNAASSLFLAMKSNLVTALYTVGILACVFHLANGIWTMGITWGVWVSPAAQRRANWVCVVFGIGLGIVGLSALGGAKDIELLETALDDEDKMYKAHLESGVIQPPKSEDPHKTKRFSLAERAEADKEANDKSAAESADTDETATANDQLTVPTARNP